jgi:glycosyltransferase involved in cell wall biosynthesis
LVTTARVAAQEALGNIRTVAPRGLLARASAGPRRIIADQLFAAVTPADLLYFFDLTGPLLAPRRPFVTTLHDAGVSRGITPPRHAYKRRLQPWAVRHAQAVVAVSAFARDEAVRWLAADPGRVHVIHSGPGLLPAAGGRTPHPPQPYFLYVGKFAEYKNLPLLIEAHARAAVPEQLLLVGEPWGRNDALSSALRTAAGIGGVRVISNAGDDEIDRLYRGATALLLPSTYEGFGFTPLEAMSRGCPVVASDIPALRETCGAGVLLVPPDDEIAWAEALRRISGDEHLRDDLRERGTLTAARYSWEATARRVCELLESVPL